MNTEGRPDRATVRELVLASAGSGKTYRISSRLIGLLAAGEEPRSLLASTFTRKAAGEILQRVLVRLARAAMDESEATALSAATLSGGKDLDTEGWAGLLRATVAELHRLNVGTLDAFFVRAAQAFAYDLGLPPRWGIADEPTRERVRAEALDRVLDRMDTDRFLGILRSLHADAVNRSVHDRLASDIEGILAVHRAIEPGSPGWSALARVAGPPEDGLAERLAALSDRIEACPVPLTAAGKPSAAWEKALPKLATAVRSGDFVAVVKDGPGKAFLTSPDPAEATYSRIPFTDALRDAVGEAVEIARAGIARSLAARAAAMGEVAQTYEGSFEAGLKAAGRMGFDDVTRALVGGGVLGDPSRLGYRLDTAMRHLLLDEFQDTSSLQWQALVPFADALAEHGGGDTVVVADPKQSIYGWRGAEPSVVREFARRLDLAEDTLAKSWRSSPVVLDAVNRVFSTIQGVSVLGDDRSTVDEWCSAFTRHEAARERLPGHVRLLVGPSLEGRGRAQPAFSRFAARQIADLHAASPGRSIGVLVRGNAEVARLIVELGTLGVPASEEGGTSLLDSAAVVSVLALLRLVDHPGDGLSRYHVAATAVGAAVGLGPEDGPAKVHAVTRTWRRRLVEDGYGKTLAALAHEIDDSLSGREGLRFGRLVELGFAWDAAMSGAGLRVDGFVRLAETARAESPGEDPVRVMTFHGSKGLEFDAVVLPQVHGSVFGGGRESAPVGYRPGPMKPVTHAFPYVPKDVLELFRDFPELTEAMRQRRAETLRDALGVLYVGMTRARHALHLLIPADAGGRVGEAVTPARVLRETLPDVPATDPVTEGQVLYEAGDPGWAHLVAPAPRRKPSLSERRRGPISLRAHGPRTRGLDRRTPSGMGNDDTVDVPALLGIGRSEGALKRGSVVHAWLETVEWTESGLASEERLRSVAGLVAPDWSGEQVESTLGWLRARLAAPRIAEALSRGAWPQGTRVERERPFLWREGDALVEGVIDRLVLVPGPGGTIAEATVIDYKTDRLGEDPLRDRDRERHYREQVSLYARAVASLFGLPAERVRGMLLFLDSGDALLV